MSIAMSCTTRKVDPSIVLPSVFSSIPELCVESIIDPSTSHNEIPGNDPSSRSSGYVPKIPWQTPTDPAATDPLASDRPTDPLSSTPSTSLTYNSKTNLGASSEPIIFSLPSDTTCHQKSTRTYVAPSEPFPFANSSIPTPTRSQRQLPSISIAGAASFQKLIDSGEEVYALNIRAIPEPPIEALRVIAHIPAPTSSLYTEALPEDEAEMIAKVVPAEYHEFVDVFSREEAKAMPPHRPYDHKVDTENDQVPPRGPIYPMSEVELKALREFLDDMLGKGFIRSSQSPGGAPVLFARNKEGTLRLVVDFRALNKITKKNRYPIPLIGNLIDQLRSAKIYTKFDLRAGYYNV